MATCSPTAGNAYFAERFEEKSHHHTTDKCSPPSLLLPAAASQLCACSFGRVQQVAVVVSERMQLSGARILK